MIQGFKRVIKKKRFISILVAICIIEPVVVYAFFELEDNSGS
jgi:hypothetical protein